MPKSQYVDPGKAFDAGYIHFEDIPVCQYKKTLAEEKKIPYQREILTYGGTDTSAMQLSGGGSRAGALSIPSRYSHSGVELCDLGDAEACVSLAIAFLTR